MTAAVAHGELRKSEMVVVCRPFGQRQAMMKWSAPGFEKKSKVYAPVSILLLMCFGFSQGRPKLVRPMAEEQDEWEG